jgi:hypothetical protein
MALAVVIRTSGPGDQVETRKLLNSSAGMTSSADETFCEVVGPWRACAREMLFPMN